MISYTFTYLVIDTHFIYVQKCTCIKVLRKQPFLCHLHCRIFLYFIALMDRARAVQPVSVVKRLNTSIIVWALLYIKTVQQFSSKVLNCIFD